MYKISELLANYEGEAKYQVQLKKVFDAWQQQPATMKEIEVLTSVDRANICRYVATLRKAKLIAALGKRECRITGRIATEFTTDASLFPEDLQTRLFTTTISNPCNNLC